MPTKSVPKIVTQPLSQTITEGQIATFTVTATDTNTLYYQWQKNGINISGATSNVYKTPAVTLADNQITFRVIVRNRWRSVDSNSAILSVTPLSPQPPLITTQPSDQIVTVGQTAQFSVIATGSPPLSYQWKINGNNIAGATNSSYTTNITTLSDNGAVFSVVVTNSVGSTVSNSVRLIINSLSATDNITISWNTVADAMGYNIYWGTTSNTYAQKKRVTGVSNITISNCDPTKSYYFAIKAYNSLNIESAFSNELVAPAGVYS